MPATPASLADVLGAIERADTTAAERLCREFIATNRNSASGWYFLGVAQQLGRKPAEAVTSYESAVALDPNLPEARNNLAVLLLAQGKPAEAEANLRHALQVQPNYPDAHNNLGTVLQATGRFEDAASAYHRALALKPNNVDVLNNLGNTLRSTARIASSIDFYNAALAIDPSQPRVHLNRAFAWLQQGDFARGWPEYEWRLQCPEYAIPNLPRPRWDGSPLAGRTILLYADYGFGDTIQFIRYATLVQDRGGRVIVASRQPLARLLASHPSIEQVIPEGATLPEFDAWSPVTSLPGIFGTTLETIPASVPYLRPHDDLVAEWRHRLQPISGRKIGIAWQGNPEYQRDRDRSFSFERFEEISRIDGVNLISIQRGFGCEQIAELADRIAVTDLGNEPRDFMDMAALVTNLDLLITPDTALAHLAGSLGIQAWVALPFAADWRWLIDREDSPWYPSLRLFRQEEWGDWDEVFRRMAVQLGTAFRVDVSFGFFRD
jgi:Tfp pilus assembly protein PilF